MDSAISTFLFGPVCQSLVFGSMILVSSGLGVNLKKSMSKLLAGEFLLIPIF